MILEGAGLDVTVFFSRQEIFVSVSLVFPKYFRYTFRDRDMPDLLAAFWRSDDDSGPASPLQPWFFRSFILNALHCFPNKHFFFSQMNVLPGQRAEFPDPKSGK